MNKKIPRLPHLPSPVTELRLLASQGLKRVQNCLSCTQRRARAESPVRSEIQLTVSSFFPALTPLTQMESPWSTEVVALRAGWTCWPRAADSYRNTKTHLIGWDLVISGKELAGSYSFLHPQKALWLVSFFPEKQRWSVWDGSRRGTLCSRQKEVPSLASIEAGMFHSFVMNRFFFLPPALSPDEFKKCYFLRTHARAHAHEWYKWWIQQRSNFAITAFFSHPMKSNSLKHFIQYVLVIMCPSQVLTLAFVLFFLF